MGTKRWSLILNTTYSGLVPSASAVALAAATAASRLASLAFRSVGSTVSRSRSGLSWRFLSFLRSKYVVRLMRAATAAARGMVNNWLPVMVVALVMLGCGRGCVGVELVGSRAALGAPPSPLGSPVPRHPADDTAAPMQGEPEGFAWWGLCRGAPASLGGCVI